MSETSTVVEHVDTEEQYAVLSSSNYSAKFTVFKPRGHYHFFKVRVEKGATPNVLSGSYSSLDNGIKAVKKYLDNSKETFAVKSDRLDKERKERHASKANPSND